MNDSDLPALNPTRPGLYRHYKGGLYEVIDTARHSETLEPMTVYRALYGEQGLWVCGGKPAGSSGWWAELECPRFVFYIGEAGSEGKRIGQRSDSKSDAPKGVVGSNPMPSAWENPVKNANKPR